MVSITSRPLFSPRKYLVPILQQARWAPWLVCTGAENFASTGILSPDLPAITSRYTVYAIFI